MSHEKKGQRTKGNVKPSSSAKAAQLLSNHGYGGAGFVGFGEVASVDEINSNFRVLLRSVTKKDTKTKVKALKEIQTLIAHEDDVEITKIWPQFARTYCKLALDADFKVREEAHNVLKIFGEKLGRQMAVELKSVMPFWLIGQNDAYSSVSNAAKLAFSSVFSNIDKQSQAIDFCEASVVTECSDLLENAEKFYKSEITEKKVAVPGETMENIEILVERVQTSILKTLAALFKRSKGTDQTDRLDLIKLKLFDKPKFWTLIKTKSGQVKSAWLELIGVLICHYPDLCKEKSGQICPILVNNLEKQDLAVCKRAWSSILASLQNFSESFWNHVNFQKALLPKLWSVLRKGGDGCATVVGPSLLPLLVHILNRNAELDVDQFSIKFMQNFEQGIRILHLEKKFAYQEKCAWVKSYCDCLIFLCSKFLDQPPVLRELLVEQFASSLLPVILPCASSMPPEECGTLDCLSCCIDDMLKKYDVTNVDDHSQVIFKQFFEKLVEFFEKSIIDNTNVNVSKLLPKLIDHPENHCCSLVASTCKCCWLHFFDIPTTIDRSAEKNIDGSIIFLKSFNAIIEIVPNSKFVELFENEPRSSVAVDQFMCRIFKSIEALDMSDSKIDRNYRFLIGCMFAMKKFISREDQLKMLRKCLQLKSSTFGFGCLEQLARFATDFDEVAKSKQFEECFMRCCDFLLCDLLKDSNYKLDWKVFSHFLTSRHNGKIILPQTLVDGVFEKLINFLDSHGVVDREILIKCVDLVLSICQAVFENSPESCQSSISRDLMSQLLDLMLNGVLNNDLAEKFICLLVGVVNSDFRVSFDDKNLERSDLLDFLTGKLLNRLENETFRTVELQNFVDTTFKLFCALFGNKSEKNFPSTKIDGSTLICKFLPGYRRLGPLFDKLSEDYRWKFNAQLRGFYPTFQLLDDGAELNEKMQIFSEKSLRFCAYSSLFCLKLASCELLLNFQSQCEFFDEILLENFCNTYALLIYAKNLSEFQSINFSSHSGNDIFGPDGRAILNVMFRTYEKMLDEGRLKISETALNQVMSIKSKASDLIQTALPYVLTLAAESVFTQWTEIWPNMFDEQKYFTLFRMQEKNIQLRIIDESGLDLQKLNDWHKIFVLTSNCPNLDTKIEILSQFSLLQSQIGEKLLFSGELSKVDQHSLLLNVSIIDFLQSLAHHIDLLESSHVDTIFCAVLGFLQTCVDSILNYSITTSHIYFYVKALQLFNSIDFRINSISSDMQHNGCKDDQKKSMAFAEDWAGFFLAPCQSLINRLFCKLYDSENKNIHRLIGYVRRELAKAVLSLDSENFLQTANFALLLDPELDALHYPQAYQSILLNLCPLLLNADRSFKVGAYSVLKKIVPKMYQFECKSLDDVSSSSSREQELQLPSYLISNMKACTEDCNLFAVLDSYPDANQLSSEILCKLDGFLLTWKLLLAFFQESVPTKNRPAYSRHLTNSGLLKGLLSVVFRLLDDCSANSIEKPTNQLSGCEKYNFSSLLYNRDVSCLLNDECFLNEPNLDPTASSNIGEVKQLACNVYFETMRLFPAAIRQWWSNLDKKAKNHIDRFTSRYASQLMCSLELRDVNKGERQYGKMTLFTRTAAKEIVAVYKFEDLNMELVVKLPSNYPLQPVNVEAIERVGVAKEKWRKWMLQLVVFLTHQNGSIFDGLLLWKSCVDKHLEGVEECMICMMAVHGSSYQLPKISCKQCKQKFHAACLYKWFDTSNKSSCPMCRTEFA